MVLEVPPKALGAIDEYWFRWVIDIGLPGLDRGAGGKMSCGFALRWLFSKHESAKHLPHPCQ